MTARGKQAQQQTSPFVFIGDALVLDLVNTDMIQRGKRHDVLTTGAAASAWWVEAQQHYPTIEHVEGRMPDGERLLEPLRQFRDVMRRLFAAVIRGQEISTADMDALNAQLVRGDRAVRAHADGTFSVGYHVDDDLSSVLLPMALSAARLLTEADLGRLHACHNERCILLFYDVTKNGTRQWCSVSCMDRARSRQRYAQRHQ